MCVYDVNRPVCKECALTCVHLVLRCMCVCARLYVSSWHVQAELQASQASAQMFQQVFSAGWQPVILFLLYTQSLIISFQPIQIQRNSVLPTPPQKRKICPTNPHKSSRPQCAGFAQIQRSIVYIDWWIQDQYLSQMWFTARVAPIDCPAVNLSWFHTLWLSCMLSW